MIERPLNSASDQENAISSYDAPNSESFEKFASEGQILLEGYQQNKTQAGNRIRIENPTDRTQVLEGIVQQITLLPGGGEGPLASVNILVRKPVNR